MKTKLPKWYLKFPDWKRVLWYWTTHAYRHGLSIHALAAICRRNPHTILKEMRSDRTSPGKVDAFFCHDVGAPLWGYRSRVDSGFNRDAKAYAIISKATLKAWPYPRYKGILDMQPQTSINDIDDTAGYGDVPVKFLRQVAKGTAKNVFDGDDSGAEEDVF